MGGRTTLTPLILRVELYINFKEKFYKFTQKILRTTLPLRKEEGIPAAGGGD